MEWEDIGGDVYVNKQTGQRHKCTWEECDSIVMYDVFEHCSLTGKAFSSKRTMERPTDVHTGTLRTFTHVRAQRDEAVIREEQERTLHAYFDNVLFNVESLTREERQALYKKRIKERGLRDRNIIRALFDNPNFTQLEKDFWVGHALTLHSVYGPPNSRPENHLLCLMSFAADPEGLQVGNVVHIYPNPKVMMRFPLRSEIQRKTDIECSVLTTGKKNLQFFDWSIYPHPQIKL